MKVCVVIPALNEESAIGLVLRDLPRELVSEVFVVDNGSRDATAERAAAAGAPVVREPRRGYGSACLAGLARLPADCDVVVFLDADHSDHPEEIGALLEPIRRGEAELVIGSRMLGEAEPGALLPQARYGNALACLLMRLFFGHRFTDLGPFRAVTRSALDRIGMVDTNFGWTVEMQVKALQRGIRVAEVPVRYRRRTGVSKITGTVSGTLKAGAKILFTIFRYAFSGRGGGWRDSVLLAIGWRYATHAVMLALALWNEARPAPSLPDRVLDLIPKVDWIARHNYHLWFAAWVPLATALLVRDRTACLRFLWLGGWVSLARGLTIPLTGLGPVDAPDVNAGAGFATLFRSWVAIVDPVSALSTDAAQVGLTKDLFFSGHVATTFLLWLYCRHRPRLGPAALVAHLATTAFVLLAHLHYAIDVVGAWAIAFSAYVLAEGWAGLRRPASPA